MESSGVERWLTVLTLANHLCQGGRDGPGHPVEALGTPCMWRSLSLGGLALDRRAQRVRRPVQPDDDTCWAALDEATERVVDDAKHAGLQLRIQPAIGSGRLERNADLRPPGELYTSATQGRYQAQVVEDHRSD